MSADPEAPADPQRMSGGHIIRNMIYSHDDGNNLEIVTGWTDQGGREYDQEVVRPGKRNLSKAHPCYELNADVLRCSFACPSEMKLGGRTAVCNAERKLLMQCFVRHKKWREGEAASGTTKPWYTRLW